MAERLYQFSRVRSGDYLLPGNDARTLWRIAHYDEEFIGPDSETVELKLCWGIWKWTHTLDSGHPVDTQDWNEWEFFEGFLKTRREAIDRAVELA